MSTRGTYECWKSAGTMGRYAEIECFGDVKNVEEDIFFANAYDCLTQFVLPLPRFPFLDYFSLVFDLLRFLSRSLQFIRIPSSVAIPGAN